jgi:hypothetical protein
LTIALRVRAIDVALTRGAIKPIFADNRRVHLVDGDHQAFVKTNYFSLNHVIFMLR